jgi:hypothetical protein
MPLSVLAHADQLHGVHYAPFAVFRPLQSGGTY